MELVMRIKGREEREQIFLSWLSLYPILYTPVIFVANFVIAKHSKTLASGIRYALFVLLGILFIGCVRKIIVSFSTGKLAVILFFFLQYAFQILYTQSDTGYYLGLVRTTGICLIFFVAASTIHDYRIFYSVIKKASYLILFCVLAYLAFDGTSAFRAHYGVSYGQALSYCFAFAAVVFVIETVRRPNILNIASLAVSVAVAMLLGTRGVLICMAVSALLSFLSYRRMNSEKTTATKLIVTIVLVITALVALFVFYEQILDLLLRIEDRIGGNGRVIHKILTNTFMTSEGRESLWDNALRLIHERPFLGYGLATERIALQMALVELSPIYAHNIILEVLLQYGVVIGVILMVWFSRRLIRSFVRAKENKPAVCCYIALISTGLVPLFMSSSYLQWESFFILIGFLYGAVRIRQGSDLPKNTYSDSCLIYFTHND